jgi:hypothetical protein
VWEENEAANKCEGSPCAHILVVVRNRCHQGHRSRKAPAQVMSDFSAINKTSSVSDNTVNRQTQPRACAL